MKKVVRNAAYQAFIDAAESIDLGTRIKKVRDQPLQPGGRVRMTLFERVSGGRAHPRMRFEFVEVEDPKPPGSLFEPATAPTTAAALREAIDSARSTHAELLDARDVADQAPALSPKYWRNRIRVTRTAALLSQVRSRVMAWLDDGTLPGSERAGCLRVVAEIADEAYAGTIAFDDSDTGTYHSYGKDAPFVHYLEALLESLPTEGGDSMATLPSGTRQSVRRQRDQLQAHLDWLMRHKYAYKVIEETNIEKTVGGFLIDRNTRNIASETADSDPLAPSYELLRIAPSADHTDAGAWLYRDADGKLRRQDHQLVDVDPQFVRQAPLDVLELTFRRAPKDTNLRPGVRLDWDDNGWVKQGRIDWVSWAGHCDIKAVQEQLGLTLTEDPKPAVHEYRSDTGQTKIYDRDLLLEMVTSVMELGSVYSHVDGTGRLQRGVHHFGGSRNDSRPDRLQFQGTGQGRSFRWPLGGRQDSFRVQSMELPDGTKPDMGTVFFRHLPDVEKITLSPNPRYLKTIEGDYNLIDVSGAKLEARIKVDSFDPSTGYPKQSTEQTVIDLRPDADAGPTGRFFLGTHMDDVTARKLFRVYYEPSNNRIVAEKHVYTEQDGEWKPTPLPEENVEIQLRAPLTCTLSREMKRDDPSQFTALLELAQQQARNICADTDKESAVWNGVVTGLSASKLGSNADSRTEHWSVDIKARFGEATLQFLVRRDDHGEPEAYCPATSDRHWGDWPDFLWHDVPDVGSKGKENGDWIVNETMIDRELVTVRVDDSVPSGFYVYDDHIKNVFELVYAGLAGLGYTVVHGNKRHGFATEPEWKAAVAQLEARRGALTFEQA